LVGITNQDDFIENAINDCKNFEAEENFAVGQDSFKFAHRRIMEISKKIKEMISGLTPD